MQRCVVGLAVPDIPNTCKAFMVKQHDLFQASATVELLCWLFCVFTRRRFLAVYLDCETDTPSRNVG